MIFMKETTPKNKDQVQHIQPAQHAKKQVLVHRMRLQPGQKLFEYSVNQNTLSLAKFSEPSTASYTKAVNNGNPGLNKKVDVKQDTFYVAAINFKNAIKQLRKVFKDVEPEIIKPCKNP